MPSVPTTATLFDPVDLSPVDRPNTESFTTAAQQPRLCLKQAAVSQIGQPHPYGEPFSLGAGGTCKLLSGRARTREAENQ